MLVVIMNEVNLGQIYLWYQEKSLFGMGALLHNASPGEYLTGGDMVRNLVLSGQFLADQYYHFKYIFLEFEFPHNWQLDV